MGYAEPTAAQQPSFWRQVSQWLGKGPGKVDVTQIQVFFKTGTTLYTLTATGLTKSFDHYEPVVLDIISSFKVSVVE